MDGTHGRILVVDLTAQRFMIESVSEEMQQDWLGGKGLASRLLYDMNPPGVDPLSPENRIIFACGPFAGTPMWGGSRYGVFTKSPLTGAYAESYSGGKTPESLDRAGFDAVVLSGRAEATTVLAVHPQGCIFHDATGLQGMETWETEKAILQRYACHREGFGKSGAVVIGPAGERMLPFAVISNDRWHCAGRTGVGAVLGSKNVKGLVFDGDRKRPLHNASAVRAFAGDFMRQHRNSPGVKAYRARGTTQMVALMNTAGAFPARYWNQGTCDHWEAISGDRYHQEHDVRPSACLKCFMACGRKATIRSGRHQGLTIEGPEYETIYAFGGLCMIEDMAEIVRLNDLCDRLGMDTITAGNLCALAMEGAARGRLNLDISYGDAEAVASLIHDMAAGRGLGKILARGIVAASRALDLEDLAVHVKGMEPAGYEPRVLKGMGLSYAVSPRGACHLRTTFYKAELSGMIAPDTVHGKAAMVVDFEDRLALFDCLVLCRFFRDMYQWEPLCEAVSLVTGLPADADAMREKARRVCDLVRRFNLREGIGAESDRLPRRLTSEVLPSGHSLNEDELQTLVSDYYSARGWDANGVPPDQNG